MEGPAALSGVSARFDAVVFDLFGTLVPELTREEFFGSVEQAARSLGCDVEAFRSEWIATAPQRQTGGFATIKDNVRGICAAIGAPEPGDDELAGSPPTPSAWRRRDACIAVTAPKASSPAPRRPA